LTPRGRHGGPLAPARWFSIKYNSSRRGYNSADGDTVNTSISISNATESLRSKCQCEQFNQWKEVPKNRMNNSNSPSNPTPSRVTLKLKVAARKSARESKTPPLPPAHSKVNGKPGAHWSDEYKDSSS
jgi:hypothetical protein